MTFELSGGTYEELDFGCLSLYDYSSLYSDLDFDLKGLEAFDFFFMTRSSKSYCNDLLVDCLFELFACEYYPSFVS